MEQKNVSIWLLNMGVSAWSLSVYPILGLAARTHVLSFDFEFFQSLGLYIIAVDRDQGDSTDLAKIMLVQPFVRFTATHPREISCMQLTDRRVYFTWDDENRCRDITLFKDNTLDLLSPAASSTVKQLDDPWGRMELEFGRHYHTLIRGAAHVLTNKSFGLGVQRAFPLVVLILACCLKAERERPEVCFWCMDVCRLVSLLPSVFVSL